ncbi:MAG: hypothetical protein K0T99_03605 [Alphaproteobacteria bacterium]|nr:hypothetical protein [Alphaproteobacteria bacterium]
MVIKLPHLKNCIKIMSIPKKINYVWVTSGIKPEEPIIKEGKNIFSDAYTGCFVDPKKCVSPDVRINYFHNIKKMVEVFEGWEINFWTNDRGLIPESVSLLESVGVNVRSFYELAEEGHKNHDVLEFIKTCDFETLRKIGSVGAFVDFIKYLVIYNEGGVSVDLNFAVKNKITDECLKSKMIILDNVENYFFASVSKNPYVETLLNSFSIDRCQESEGNSYTALYWTNFLYTAANLVLKKSVNPYLNIDVFYSKDNRFVSLPDHCVEEGADGLVGVDLHQNTWANFNGGDYNALPHDEL